MNVLSEYTKDRLTIYIALVVGVLLTAIGDSPIPGLVLLFGATVAWFVHQWLDGHRHETVVIVLNIYHVLGLVALLIAAASVFAIR